MVKAVQDWGRGITLLVDEDTEGPSVFIAPAMVHGSTLRTRSSAHGWQSFTSSSLESSPGRGVELARSPWAKRESERETSVSGSWWPL